ncbi:MAG: hypothetical protein ACLRSH_06560 [Turicibacter sp.]|jgi:hypothetical protein
MISIEVIEKLLDILILVLLLGQRKTIETNQDRLEFIVNAVMIIVVLSL